MTVTHQSPTHPLAPLPPLLVMPWDDPVTDQTGVDPRSSYAERFWLPLLGPTSTWMIRRFATEIYTHPEGFSLEATDIARSLGIGTKGGRSGPLPRSVDRLVRFGLAHHAEHGILTVRRRLPPLSRAQAHRLPGSLQEAHDRWLSQRRSRADHPSSDSHVIRLALSMLDVGVPPAEVEDQLRRWSFDDASAARALHAALDRQRSAS